MHRRAWSFVLICVFGTSPTPGLSQARYEASSAPSRYDSTDTETYRVDRLGRILEVSSRRPVACPRQTARTAVLLVAGQSNAANYAKTRFRTAHPTRVVNLFHGNCFSAASPLIGSEGRGGESWTLLADELIDAGLFDRVVLVASGIGSTDIDRWREGADLNRMLLDTVRSVQPKYKITHVLWHQGETDLVKKTSADEYVARFSSFVSSLRKANVLAPIYLSVASKCGSVDGWTDADPVETAQRGLVNPSELIYAGPNTNVLVSPDDRFDKCHFAESGQRKFAAEWVRILRASTPSAGATTR